MFGSSRPPPYPADLEHEGEQKQLSDEKLSDTVRDPERPPDTWHANVWIQHLLSWGVESRGIQPVQKNERTDTQYSKIFFIWFSSNVNILSFSAGTLGPVTFGLGLRDACLVILFFNMLCCIPPAYFATWGPKLGMRQMIISRYSFGFFGVILPCIINLAGMVCFCALNSIVGGQALASVNGTLSWSVGIVIVVMISLLVSFCGYTVLAWFERLFWIPVVIAFVVALGVGGKHLSSPPAAEPTTVMSVLSFASTLAGFLVTFSLLSSDFTIYFRPEVSSWRIFIYSYLGFLIPLVVLQVLGAVFAVAAPSVPEWDAGYAGGNVGGLLEAMLHPTKGFGKLLTVLLSLSVAGNIAATFYSATLNWQIIIPRLVVVPRYVFSIVMSAAVIPVAIVGAHRFYDALVNFLGVISYWACSYVAIVLIEHIVFRRNSAEAYDIDAWNKPRRLPLGVAGVTSVVACWGLVVPSMYQVWYVGPIAQKTGDIGFEVAFVLSAALYLPLRALEIKLWKDI